MKACIAVSDKFHTQDLKYRFKKSYNEILDHRLDAKVHGGKVLPNHLSHETVCSSVYTVTLQENGFVMVICAIKKSLTISKL
jgi:hypothetical protein